MVHFKSDVVEGYKLLEVHLDRKRKVHFLLPCAADSYKFVTPLETGLTKSTACLNDMKLSFKFGGK
jgi:hypothetical protein